MENLEKMFEIKTVPSCPANILQSYRADEIFGIYAAEKFQVKTKEKTFTTTMYPFLQTDYFVDELMGTAYFFRDHFSGFLYFKPNQKRVRTLETHRSSHTKIFPTMSSEHFLINFMG